MTEWIDDARGGTWRSHFASPANVYDVCMWSVLCLANVLRACAANLCVPVGDPSIAANHTTLLDLSVAAVNEVRRQLRGGGGYVGGDDESDVVGTPTSDSALLYEGACVTQDVSHIILTITVIFAAFGVRYFADAFSTSYTDFNDDDEGSGVPTTSRVALMAVTHATVADSGRLWSSRGCGSDALPYAPMTLTPATSSGSATHVAFRSSSSASPAV